MSAATPRPVRNLDEAFAACLDDLDAGLSPAEALAHYPDYAEALAPLLETSARLRGANWSALSMSGRVRGRERMHAELEKRQRRAGMAWWRAAWRQFGVALALVILAAGAWLAWPGREVRTITQPTAMPTAVTLPEDATPRPTSSATATASASPTVLPDKSETRVTVTPGPRATATGSALTVPATQTPGLLASTPPVRTPTPRPASTKSPERTETPEPPEPTKTPKPGETETPRPTETPEPPEPTKTPKPGETETPRPTKTPEPPESTKTPKPDETETPRPTKTPEPPESTKTPEPGETESPEPTTTPESDSAIIVP